MCGLLVSENQAALGDAGAVELLLTTLRTHAMSPPIVTQALWALWYLVVALEPNRRRAVAAGARQF